MWVIIWPVMSSTIPEILVRTLAGREVPPALADLPDPAVKYLIAFTPRSGSSYLCDTLERCRTVGIPREILNKDLMPIVAEMIPGRDPHEYVTNVLRTRMSSEGVSGLKATWLQFAEFNSVIGNEDYWRDYRFIYLTRRDAAAQAVSLYKAVKSGVFHTNVTPNEEAVARLRNLDYSYNEIHAWYQHILEQERGWESYFTSRAISPLRISYEDITIQLPQVINSIMSLLGVTMTAPLDAESSVFRKVGDSRNDEWAIRFSEEHRVRTGTPLQNNRT